MNLKKYFSKIFLDYSVNIFSHATFRDNIFIENYFCSICLVTGNSNKFAWKIEQHITRNGY